MEDDVVVVALVREIHEVLTGLASVQLDLDVAELGGDGRAGHGGLLVLRVGDGDAIHRDGIEGTVLAAARAGLGAIASTTSMPTSPAEHRVVRGQVAVVEHDEELARSSGPALPWRRHRVVRDGHRVVRELVAVRPPVPVPVGSPPGSRTPGQAVEDDAVVEAALGERRSSGGERTEVGLHLDDDAPFAVSIVTVRVSPAAAARAVPSGSRPAAGDADEPGPRTSPEPGSPGGRRRRSRTGGAGPPPAVR